MDKNKIKVPKEEFYKALSEMKIKKCFHPNCEADAGEILHAHSIQRARLLEYLADDINGNNEVYYLDDKPLWDPVNEEMSSKMRLKKSLHHRGIKNASTFSGFCGLHDKGLFQIIEDQEFTCSKEQLFYHTYRTFAYSIHQDFEVNGAMTNAGKKINEFIESIPKVEIDPIEEGEDESEYKLHGAFLDIANTVIEQSKNMMSVFGEMEQQGADLNKKAELKKKWLNDILIKKEFSAFHYLTFKIKGLIPIASSTLVPVQHPMLMDIKNPWPMDLAITAFPIQTNNTTYIILAGDLKDFRITGLLNLLRNGNNNESLKYISDLLLYKGYNVYLSPRYIEKLNEQEMTEIISMRLAKDDKTLTMPKIKLNLFAKKFEDMSCD